MPDEVPLVIEGDGGRSGRRSAIIYHFMLIAVEKIERALAYCVVGLVVCRASGDEDRVVIDLGIISATIKAKTISQTI